MTEQPDVKKDIEFEDVEAHRVNDDPEYLRQVDSDDDDVEGHRVLMVQPPRDADNSGNQY